MGLKVFSQQFRESVLQLNLSTPPDIVVGLSDLVGVGNYTAYKDALGKDAQIKNTRQEVVVKDPGNLGQLAVAPRTANLNKNLQTPQDVFLGIQTLSPSAAAAQQYLGGRGVETVLHDYSVTNPGSVDTYATVELTKLLGKNITRNQNDPSQSDQFVFGQGYNYTTMLAGIGKLTTIADYNVRNLASVTLNPNITPEVQYQLSVQQNRYMPTEPNQFEVVVNQLTSDRQPYVNIGTGEFIRYQAEEYQASDFISGSAATGTLSQLTSNSKELLKTDTVLMNIAAMELKFNFENRILNAIERETLGKTKFDEAMSNPLTAIEILKDPSNVLEKNWEITTAPGAIGKALSLFNRISGIEIPTNIIPDTQTLMPGNFSAVSVSNENDTLLRYTGGGQKFALNAMLAWNKYTPIFSKKRNAGQYIGGMDGNPLELTSDKSGNTVLSNEKLSQDYEPKLQDIEIGEYGKVSSNFAWVGKLTQTNGPVSSISSYGNFKTLFTQGSILATTQSLLDSVDEANSVAKTAIDQTKKKFDDGYRIISRGSGVLGISMSAPQSTPDEGGGTSTKHIYKVPNRKKRDEMNDAEMCRVWTKERPYTKITDTIRYKELLRKERNSVIDGFGNYNIFPSQLNVNEGYGRAGNGVGDATVEAFGEKRARKYMFSIENLAWRDSKQFTDLPSCEKGSNGGRIMWFPPYDIKFAEENSVSLNTHQFLGRPEPIYTYNNTERSGALSFKIVVDHPSILNTLVKYELNRLSDEQVDEILNSFWSGCVEYDVFELARIWGVLTDQDINYFKNVIADLDPVKSNELNKQNAEKALGSTTEAPIIAKEPPHSNINGHALYFENDTPYDEKAWGATDAQKTSVFGSVAEADKFFTIQPYDKYYELYKSQANGAQSPLSQVFVNNRLNPSAVYSGYALKSALYPDAGSRNLYAQAAAAADYSKSIGVNHQGLDHFFAQEGFKQNGFEKQKTIIETDLRDDKYKGFDVYIDATAYASPINSAEYNDKLAYRRFKSVVKWLALSVFKNQGVILRDDTPVTEDNIEEVFAASPDTAVFYKNEKDMVVITNKSSKEINKADLIEEIKKDFPTVKNGVYTESYDGKTYTCHIDSVDKNSANEYVGSLEPADKTVRRTADIVCADLSIIASRARRVDLKVKAVAHKKTKKPVSTQKEQTQNYKQTGPSVTKREVAQRLLNKLITECDYFEYLKDKSPVVYATMKEKLKYFQPSFHAMTPEGLNARLTFLQQCLRPGETIRTSTGQNCDATNTSFGKPPVCVLRIGDLYNTKIFITNLAIDYDPLVWDLNPEGIGAQPMLATVNMSVKYIGGSGLRKYVEELQNALSFNYYANTDMYDERTFANNNSYERSLLNLEEDFFNNNTLDIAKIIDLEQIKVDLPEHLGEQTTMVGKIAETLPPHMPGGGYSKNSAEVKAEDFQGNKTYALGDYVAFTKNVADDKMLYVRNGTNAGSNTYPEPTETAFWSLAILSPSSVLVYNGLSYERRADNPTSNQAPNGLNTSVWNNLGSVNHGEQAYLKEYGRTYMTLLKVDYTDAFKRLYQSYTESLGTYVGVYENFLTTKTSPLMVNFLMKQHYGLDVKSNTLSSLTNNTFGSGVNQRSQDVYSGEANERRYKKYTDLGSLTVTDPEKLRLHLYPTDKFYKMTDGLDLNYPTNKFDPGPFDGIYFKDKIGVFDNQNTKKYIDFMSTTLSQKIDHDMLKFINQNETVFNSYMRDLNQFDREGLRVFLKEKLSNYMSEIGVSLENTSSSLRNYQDKVTEASDQIHKIGVVLNGADGLGEKIYTEVSPNGTVVKNIDALFGYDPYKFYPIVHLDTATDAANTANTKNVRTYSLESVSNMIGGRTAGQTQYLKYLRLGNGHYYFKQIGTAAVTGLSAITDAPFLDNTRLPYLTTFVTGTIQANNVAYRSIGNETKRGLFVGQGVDVSLSERTDSYDTNQKMTTVFEKLNYEMLDFSNKTLSVMMNDTIADTSTTFDTVLDVDSELRKQLNYLLSYTNQAPSADQMVSITDAIVGTDDVFGVKFLTTSFTNLNSQLSFPFKFTADYLATYAKNSSNPSLPNGLLNQTLKVNYYDELLLLGFYQSLFNNDTKALVEEFKKVLNVTNVTPKAGLNGRQQKDYITQMIAKRTKLADDLVSELMMFLDDSLQMLDGFDQTNKKKISDFSKNCRSILFNEDSTKTLNGENFDVLAEKMLKKSDGSEYTLLMRQTTGTDGRTKSLLNKLYKA